MPTRLAVLLAAALVLVPRSPAAAPELVEVRKIWDRAPHNAFTDLIRCHGRWWWTFGEASGHVTMDGAVRVLTSADYGAVVGPERVVCARELDLREIRRHPTPRMSGFRDPAQ